MNNKSMLNTLNLGLSKHKYLFLALLLLTSCTSTAYATNEKKNSPDKNSLQYHRNSFAEYSHEKFDLGGRVSHYTWQHFTAFFPHVEINRTVDTNDLIVSLRSDVALQQVQTNSGPVSLATYVKSSPHVNGMAIMHRGKIVFEEYPNMKPHQRHLSWSVTKVMVASALAVLQRQGKVDMSLAIDHYLSSLKQSDWAGTSVQDIANMSSGMNCRDSDGYQNKTTCVYRYEESLGIVAQHNPQQETLDMIKGIKRHRPAGEEREYTSVNTFVLGWLIESITQKPLWLALEEIIWSKIHPEADALFTVNKKGLPYSSGGMVLRLRDLVRFGSIYTATNQLSPINSKHLKSLRKGHVAKLSNTELEHLAKSLGKDLPSHSAWQWDHIWSDGDMFKHGYSGQGLFVSPERDLVIAFFGTHGTDWVEHQLPQISRQLSVSELFN